MECNAMQGKEMLEALRAIDFSIYDVILYLDAYPNCKEALEYYHRLMKDKEALSCEYQKKFGPLNPFENKSATAWQWIDNPWPWEPEAN